MNCERKKLQGLVGWFVGSLVGWFVGSLVGWFVGSLVGWFVASNLSVLKHLCAEVRGPRF